MSKQPSKLWIEGKLEELANEYSSVYHTYLHSNPIQQEYTVRVCYEVEDKGHSFIEVTEKMWNYHMMLCKVENELSDCIYGQ